MLYKRPKCNLQSRKKNKLNKYLSIGIEMNHPSFIPSLGVSFTKSSDSFPGTQALGGFRLNKQASLPPQTTCRPKSPSSGLPLILVSTFFLLGFTSLRTLPNVCFTGTPDTLHGPALSFLLTFLPAVFACVNDPELDLPLVLPIGLAGQDSSVSAYNVDL